MSTGKHNSIKSLTGKKAYIQNCLNIWNNTCTWSKKQAASCRSVCQNFLSRIKPLWTEKTKRLFFSGAVSCSVIAVVCMVLVCTCSIGCELTVNGQVIGIMRNQAEYTDLIEKINHEIAYVTHGDFTPGGEPEFSACILAKNKFTAEDDMKERLKATSQSMIPAYGVLVDHEMIFALPNEDAALSVLSNYKNSFLEGKENGTASFCQEVTVSHCFVPKAALKTEETALSALQKGRMEMYQLAQGESLDAVCAQFNIDVDELLQNNVIKDINHPTPGALIIPTGKPLISVKTQETLTAKEVIPYNTVEEEDASLYEGSLIVKQQGSDGLKVVEASVTAINGIETKRDILSESLLTAAVDHVVQKGTKELPKATGTGMAVPAKGTLTSRFGSRWGRNHNGIDMSASIGTKIYAADSGTVTYSQFNDGGYGYLIKIDHSNGLETLYAHCSELLVPAGTVVAKGDVIAKVGNSGRSTGPHLHFEVRLNGKPIDPMTYLTGLN